MTRQRQPCWENAVQAGPTKGTEHSRGAAAPELAGGRETDVATSGNRASSSLKERVFWLEIKNANGNKL